MDSELILDIAIKNTVDKYKDKTGISSLEFANLIGIKAKAVFLNKVCATNLGNRFTDKQLIKLQQITADDTITIVMHKIVKLGTDKKVTTAKDIADLLLSVSIKGGEMTRVVRDAIADGVVTQNELEKSIKKIHEKMAVLRQIEEALKGQVRRVA